MHRKILHRKHRKRRKLDIENIENIDRLMEELLEAGRTRAAEEVQSTVRNAMDGNAALDGGALGRAAVPSGASTGMHEALELRDNGKNFLGKGVNKAVNNINSTLRHSLVGMEATNFDSIDRKMIEIEQKSNSEVRFLTPPKVEFTSHKKYCRFKKMKIKY